MPKTTVYVKGENKTDAEGKDYLSDFIWTNAHHNVRFKTERYYEVWNRGKLPHHSSNSLTNWHNGIERLKLILSQAEENNKSVRAIGSRWSLSEVTISEGYLLNTQPLDIAFVGLDDKDLKDLRDGHQFVMSQCGVNISQLNRWLFEKGLALPTCGASDGQTFAGAMSTGTHGGAIAVGSVQDYVYGVHILTASNQSYWIEGGTPALSDSAILKFFGSDTQKINDDIIFNSAIVSFGSFGIISSILLRAEPIYKLNLYQKYLPLEQIKPCLINPSRLSSIGLKDNPHHVEFVINPYKIEEVIARIMYRVQLPEKAFFPEEIHDLGVDLIEVFGQIADRMPGSVDQIMLLLDKQLKENYPQIPNGSKGYPGDIFKGDQSGFRGKGVSMEIGVDVANSAKVLEMVINLASKVALPGAIGVRYIKKSKALLSIANYNTTCTIEIPAAYSKQSQIYFNCLWNELEKANIPFTFHWGQMNNLDSLKVAAKWGSQNVENWIKSRNILLPRPQQREMFANKFLKHCGLH